MSGYCTYPGDATECEWFGEGECDKDSPENKIFPCRYQSQLPLPDIEKPQHPNDEREQWPGCTLAGPDRGDCEHAVGLPGISRPGQHDGPDDTVDAWGKPNGWCWVCWLGYQKSALEAENARLRAVAESRIERDKALSAAAHIMAIGVGGDEQSAAWIVFYKKDAAYRDTLRAAGYGGRSADGPSD